MKKLYELLKLPNKHDGDFGIEVECEGENLAVPPVDLWRTVDDGSLRGAFPHGRAEWVLSAPMKLQQAEKAISDLRAWQDANNAKMNFSFRTSVHVHMNVQHLTLDQYLNVVYTYLLLENVLVRYCGPERIGNRFCLRTQDAEGITEMLQDLFRNGIPALRRINMEQAKYASINLAATNSYGSLEFRAMQGNLEVAYIHTWLRALHNLRTFAMKYKNPQAIHDAFVRNEPSRFMQEVLQDTYQFFSYEDEVNDMRQAFSITLDLPYAYVNEDQRARERQAEILRQEEELRKRYEHEAMRLQQQMERAIENVRNNNGDAEMPMNRQVWRVAEGLNPARVVFDDLVAQPAPLRAVMAAPRIRPVNPRENFPA